MDIANQLTESVGVIRFDGILLGEPADSKEFERQMSDLLGKKAKQIILDLSHVQRVNSTGLAILITAATLFTNSGGEKIALAGCNDFIKGALTVTKLEQFFNYFDSVELAMQEIQNMN
ncbi:MAG: STAS domain-containing protein [Calditrichaeota bacterium]|nr:STAS domain-containing protein [Calditrichota bacterium]